MSGMLIPIDTIGREIKARIEAGDKALDKAEQHYIAAGIQLLEAKKRLKQTGEMRFSAFLFSYCKGMKETRAYELIALGDGRTTLAEIRAKGAERVARHAEKNRQARAESSVTNGEIACLEPAAVESEVEELRLKLARAHEAIKELRSKLEAQEARADIAAKQSREAAQRAMFATADKERLADEIAPLKEQNAKLHDLVMRGGSREGLIDENGDELDGEVFVISACQSAMKTAMTMEPFCPLKRDDAGNLKTFLGFNRADWLEAKPELIRLTGMQAAVELWNIEWERDIGAPDLDWPLDEWDCLQERYRRAGIVPTTATVT